MPITVTEHVCDGGTIYASIGPRNIEPKPRVLSAYQPTYSGQIDVHIDRTTDMTLVLYNYEPVNWVTTADPNLLMDVTQRNSSCWNRPTTKSEKYTTSMNY